MDANDIIERVKNFCGYASDAALARALEMSPQKFFAQKKTGTIKKSLLLHGIEKGANPEWLKTGQGEMRTAPVNPQVACPADADTNLLGKAGVVITSGTIYGQALKQNIEAFYQAYMKEREGEKPKDLKRESGTG